MTAQRRYDLLINESEAVGFDYCKLQLAVFGYDLALRFTESLQEMKYCLD